MTVSPTWTSSWLLSLHTAMSTSSASAAARGARAGGAFDAEKAAILGRIDLSPKGSCVCVCVCVCARACLCVCV